MDGHTAACQLLISAKADVNARTSRGTEANIFARMRRVGFGFKVLTMYDKTPLKCAIDSNQHDVVALLRSVGAAE